MNKNEFVKIFGTNLAKYIRKDQIVAIYSEYACSTKDVPTYVIKIRIKDGKEYNAQFIRTANPDIINEALDKVYDEIVENKPSDD